MVSIATESTKDMWSLSLAWSAWSFLYHTVLISGVPLILHSSWTVSPCFTNRKASGFLMNLGGSAEQSKYVKSDSIPVSHVKSTVLRKSYGEHKSIAAQESKLAIGVSCIPNQSFLSRKTEKRKKRQQLKLCYANSGAWWVIWNCRNTRRMIATPEGIFFVTFERWNYPQTSVKDLTSPSPIGAAETR